MKLNATIIYMAEDNKKIGSKVDKLVMGIILGGAIGSVLGLTLAPRKGRETREIIKKKGGELIERGKEISETFTRDHRETIASAKYQFKKSGRGFLRWVLDFLRKKKSENEPMPKATIDEEE